MSDVIYLTKERVHEIEHELQELKTKGRREIAQKIADARSHGDLSENADYDAAKDEQGLLEMRIAKFGNILAKAQIIQPEEFPDDKVYILSRVTLKNKKNGSEMQYLLVSAEEADFEQNKIAVTSPLGRAMLGKTLGETAIVNVPAGITEYEVVKISK